MKPVVALALAALACGSPAKRVELAPAPSSSHERTTNKPLDDLACEPHGLVAIDSDANGALDAIRLNEALLAARDFAQRCCNGDETGDATVRVTVSPDGYKTDVAIEPENLAGGATGACLYASFHRLVVKSFKGEATTVSIVVHVR